MAVQRYVMNIINMYTLCYWVLLVQMFRYFFSQSVEINIILHSMVFLCISFLSCWVYQKQWNIVKNMSRNLADEENIKKKSYKKWIPAENIVAWNKRFHLKTSITSVPMVKNYICNVKFVFWCVMEHFLRPLQNHPPMCRRRYNHHIISCHVNLTW